VLGANRRSSGGEVGGMCEKGWELFLGGVGLVSCFSALKGEICRQGIAVVVLGGVERQGGVDEWVFQSLLSVHGGSGAGGCM
jgi:hypothetical protein